MFQTAQDVNEKVNAYFIKMRKADRCRLGLSDEMVRYAIIVELKANKEKFCFQNAPSHLNETLRSACIIEASVTVDIYDCRTSRKSPKFNCSKRAQTGGGPETVDS